MNERHPSEFWIKALLSKRRHSFSEIEAMCEMAGIGAVEMDYLHTLRSILDNDEPVPFRGHDPSHEPSVAFLRRHGIFEAWHRPSTMRLVLDLLASPKVRPLLETFILSPMKPEQAVRKINNSTGANISVETYELFRHYFWNNELLSIREWADFRQNRRVAHNEWLRLAATAQGPDGVRLLLWKTGTGPIRHIDSGKLFTHLRDIAFMKALELEHQPASKDNSIAFRNYVQSAKSAQEEVTASAAAMKDVLNSFKAFQMKTQDDKVVSIMELTDGNRATYSEAEDATGSEDDIKMGDY
jgi:hypothetical protein